jgi:hypothetical protein
MDFDEQDDDAHKFQSETIKLILKNANLPKNVAVSVDGLNENIANQIEAIKMDRYIIKNSGGPLMSSLLVTFLEGGEFFCSFLLIKFLGIYDSRMRVLLKHVSAFFGIDFEKFTQVDFLLFFKFLCV